MIQIKPRNTSLVTTDATGGYCIISKAAQNILSFVQTTFSLLTPDEVNFISVGVITPMD